MKTHILTTLALLTSLLPLHAQEPEELPRSTAFEQASSTVQDQLRESIRDLARLREEMAAEQIPLTRELNDLEAELIQARAEFQQAERSLNLRKLNRSNLATEIKARKEEISFLSGQLDAYTRRLDTDLHVSELARFEEKLDAARLAPENKNLTDLEIFEIQAELLSSSLGRLHEALGGTRFEGSAVDADSQLRKGTFVLLGPAAIFRSTDGREVGFAEQRVNSSTPATIAFSDPENTAAASQTVTDGEGFFPFDPTLGNAYKIEAIEESFVEHVKKGGPVMVPIFAMAGLALLIALYKWLALSFLRKPSRKQVASLLTAVRANDEEKAEEQATRLKGPMGRMLRAGVEHMREPRELIEEVMYETVLTTRLQVNRMLPFIAICAASAPLLGLLGTVTGIINTFKMITVFGSGDVKSLSGGISEALITTKFGLIVAIPSLLLHAFLSRKARGVITQMESAAVAFANQVGILSGAQRTDLPREVPAPSFESSDTPATSAVPTAQADPDLLRVQVRDILSEMLVNSGEQPAAEGGDPARSEPPVPVPQPTGRD